MPTPRMCKGWSNRPSFSSSSSRKKQPAMTGDEKKFLGWKIGRWRRNFGSSRFQLISIKSWKFLAPWLWCERLFVDFPPFYRAAFVPLFGNRTKSTYLEFLIWRYSVLERLVGCCNPNVRVNKTQLPRGCSLIPTKSKLELGIFTLLGVHLSSREELSIA